MNEYLKYKPIMDNIHDRISELKNIIVIKLSKTKPYKELSERDKIPFRILQAELMTLEELLNNDLDLDFIIKENVKREQYCAAEGTKRVKEWQSSHLNTKIIKQ